MHNTTRQSHMLVIPAGRDPNPSRCPTTASVKAMGNDVLSPSTSRLDKKSAKNLLLSSFSASGVPYGSCIPCARADDSVYILLAETTAHADNLRTNPRARVSLSAPESPTCLYRSRPSGTYSASAELIPFEHSDWDRGVGLLAQRFGDSLLSLVQVGHCNLFRLRLLPQPVAIKEVTCAVLHPLTALAAH